MEKETSWLETMAIKIKKEQIEKVTVFHEPPIMLASSHH